MHNVISTIKVDWGYRPCIVNGKKGLFHKWIEYRHEPYALIEHENGKVEMYHCYDINFCNSPFADYSFERKEDEEQCQSGS